MPLSETADLAYEVPEAFLTFEPVGFISTLKMLVQAFPYDSRLPLHYAGATLKEAVGFFRRQEPGWPETIDALVEEGRNSLHDSIW